MGQRANLSAPHGVAGLRGILSAVAELGHAGIEAPPGWQQRVERLDVLRNLVSIGNQRPCFERLCTAVTGGAGDIPQLLALARAEASPLPLEELLTGVYDRVLAELQAIGPGRAPFVPGPHCLLSPRIAGDRDTTIAFAGDSSRD